ncbi:Eco57I restriction-modification methylase domain-containing protein [Gemmatimonas sp.]|uniref:Eco57I restriction-modification methylase domain-containing protein n=1 Tax=Gemmatimonas sp. TaxID=1962908 RepID=UPI003DA3592F
MLTLRNAALALARADSPATLTDIARLIGFSRTPLNADATTCRSLGVASYVATAQLFEGPGMLRLFSAIRTDEPLATLGTEWREQTRRLAAALSRRAPDRHWMLLLLDHSRQSLCLATVTPGTSGVHIAALRVDPQRVLDSDAETLRALAAVTETDDLLRHTRFTDILRRDALGHRFYRALEQVVTGLAASLAPTRVGLRTPSPAERRELALLCASRCLFLAFLEAKGWLDRRRDFLLHHCVRVLEHGGRLHDKLLRPLFFGTLNTPRSQRAAAALSFGAVPFLNGGLFAPTPLEKRFRAWHFGDDAITTLVASLLDRYRFTAHEESDKWSEAAVDPEMLGRAFEGLMANDERRRSGSFYTPPALVAYAVRSALGAAVVDSPALAGLLDGSAANQKTIVDALSDAERHRLRNRLEALRVLDPACGSGAFLVHVLETLDALLAALHDPRDAHTRRRDLLARCVFGVDRQPMAVWLCELRLWLSVVIECHETDAVRIPPLPNLDHHIRVGDSLAGGSFRFAPPSARTLSSLRERYARASGARKQRIAGTLDREERTRAVAELTRRRMAMQEERRTLLTVLRGRDLFGQRRRVQRAERVRLDALRKHTRELQTESHRVQLGAALPFRFAAIFADVAAAGGFDLVVGNPPWVRPHAMPSQEREWLRREFRVMRHAAWQHGAARAGAGTGFAAQADLAAAFIERSVQLLAPHGVVGLLVPAKLWRTLSGGGVRRLLLEEVQLRVLHDWSDAPAQFDAATYPSLVVAQRPVATPSGAGAVTPSVPVRCAITAQRTVHFERHTSTLSLQGDPGAPFVLLPPAAHQAFEAIRFAGPPLATTALGRPLLGVKCGCNAAFLVHADEHLDDAATVSALFGTPRQAVIERTLLRPALRGEAIGTSNRSDSSAASETPRDVRVLWTHAADGTPLRTLPPATTRWLAHWRPQLQTRGDAKANQPWWTLFRTEAARADTPRVVWADMGRRLRSTVLATGDPTVPLNSCYVLRTPTMADALAVHALFASTVVNAWLDVLAEPARGGFRRYLGWTVAALPTPADWPRAVRLLRPFGAALMSHSASRDHASAALDAAVLEAYQLTPLLVSPLLDWYHHE